MIYEISKNEFDSFIKSYVKSIKPLVFTRIPSKEKKKYIMLLIIIHAFEYQKSYTEKEVNDILKPCVDDYVMIRRYLVDYRFLDRETDGSNYRLAKNLKDFQMFDYHHITYK